MNQSYFSLILIIPSSSYKSNPFMNAVTKLNLKVLIITNKSQIFSEYYPDKVLVVNFENWEGSLHYIREWSKKNNLKTVLGVDEESIILAAQISEVLNIEHNSLESVKLTKNKYLMRKELEKSCLSPWFRIFSVYKSQEANYSEIKYPCVIKPTFLSGSQGVLRANNKSEFIKNVKIIKKLLSRDDVIKKGGDKAKWFLVEEFIPGREISIEGIVNDGNLKELAIFDKPDTLNGPTFPETILITPTTLKKEIQIKIIGTAKIALKTLGIVKGPVHIEIRINKKGIYIIECAARSIGGLCSKALEFDGDMSLEELIIRSSLGRNINKTKLKGLIKGVMMMPIEKQGVLREIRGAKSALSLSGITELKMTVKRGEMLETLPLGDRYLGFIFAEGKDHKSIIKKLKKAWSQIEIIFEKNNSIEKK